MNCLLMRSFAVLCDLFKVNELWCYLQLECHVTDLLGEFGRLL